MNEPVIKAINLSKRYGDIQALKGINIEIMRGEFCVIAGPNGAGKTTFLRIIYGDTDPSDGKNILSTTFYSHGRDAARSRTIRGSNCMGTCLLSHAS
jgi:ABC-type multidrug transport system ATPase subunit